MYAGRQWWDEWHTTENIQDNREHTRQHMTIKKLQHKASPLRQCGEQSNPNVSMTLDHIGPTMGGVMTITIVQSHVVDRLHLHKLVKWFEPDQVVLNIVLIYSSSMSCFETDHRLAIWTAQLKSMKFWSLSFRSSGASSPPQSLIRVMGRWTVQITLQLFALSFPRVVVPQLWGTSVTQEGSSVTAMSNQTASIMSFPRKALVRGVDPVFPFCIVFPREQALSSTCLNIE